MAKAAAFGISLCLRAAVLFALWMLLVDDPDEPDMIAGAVTVVLAAVCAQVVAAGRPDVRVRPSMLRRAYRPLLLLVTDTVRVTVALVRSVTGRGPVSGRVRAVRYRATSDDDPADYGRRVLTQWSSSLGANRYVLGIDNDRQVLIVHELVDAGGPLDPLELG